MTPPFFGTKVIDDIPLSDIELLIDRDALFVGRWQFRKGADRSDWEKLKIEKAIPIFERLMLKCRANKILTPKMVYGYFRCRNSGNNLFVESDRKTFRFDFPRERRVPHRCIADFFSEGFAAFQVVTVGDAVNKETAKQFADKSYSETFYLKGLAAEAAEAVAKFGHDHIRGELGVGKDLGARFSPGYPAFPDLLDQRKIAALLEPKGTIDVSLTKTCMFVPEHTTSAIISVDPKAELFNPNL